jgi:Mrp family chromosome partitioning ATPase
LRERLREVGPKTRIIAAALPPADKSNFRGIFIIGIAGILSAAAGIALALARSFLDGRVRTPEQAIQATQSQFFGIIPNLTRIKDPIKARAPKDPQAKGKFQIPQSSLTAVTNAQQSDLWHTLRNASYSSDESLRGDGLTSIGITSLTRGEGCTTVASNFALCLAASGRRVLLVDADPYEAHLSKRFGLAEERGLVDYASNDRAGLAQYVKIEQDTGMHFLPFGGRLGARQFDWPERMSRFFSSASESYDCVVFDLPPLTMVGDVRAAAKFLDGFMLVVGWGGVSVEQMQVGLSSVQPVRAKLLGCILNKVDMRSMRWMPSRELDFIRLRKKRG